MAKSVEAGDQSRLLGADLPNDYSTPLDVTESDVGCKPEDNAFKYIQFISRDMNRRNLNIDQAIRNAYIKKYTNISQKKKDEKSMSKYGGFESKFVRRNG